MPITSTRIVLDLAEGIAIKSGTTPTISDIFSRCDLTDLTTGLGESHKWITLEPAEWLLDGNYKLLEEGAAGAQIGIMSGTISGGAGVFAAPPELTLTFDGDYDLIYGVTLVFPEIAGHYSNDVDIDFYDVGDNLLASASYTPDNFKYFCALPSTPIVDVRYIVLTFNSSNIIYRHLRLVDVWIDSVIFKNDEIKNATIVEEISPVSVSSPSNSLDFRIESQDSDFDVINPLGIYASLQRNQKVDVYETVNGTETYMGRFYLVNWEQ